VQVVQDDSPAARAGLRRGDLITEAAGRPVTSVDDLHALINGPDADTSVTLGVVRGAEELSVSVTFAAAPEEGSAT
jgi:S1-C subfamily serine protease